MRPSVSLCMTVKNEAPNIPSLADDLESQELKPDEVVISDGGSTDGTPRLLTDLVRDIAPLKLISLPGSNIAQGRNRAIAESRGELIALADAGLRLPRAWLKSLVEALQSDPSRDVVFGYILSAPQGLFETVLGAVTLPDPQEIRPERYAPSAGCMAFRRELFERFRFPEWLDFGEDMYLGLQWRAEGIKLAHVAAANVGFRPRPDLRDFFRQYYRYAQGDGVAGMWPRRHAARFAAYVAGCGLLWLARAQPLALLPLVAGGIWYLRSPFRRLLRRLEGRPGVERFLAFSLVPVIRAVGDAAKMLGYLSGVRRRFGAGVGSR